MGADDGLEIVTTTCIDAAIERHSPPGLLAPFGQAAGDEGSDKTPTEVILRELITRNKDAKLIGGPGEGRPYGERGSHDQEWYLLAGTVFPKIEHIIAYDFTRRLPAGSDESDGIALAKILTVANIGVTQESLKRYQDQLRDSTSFIHRRAVEIRDIQMAYLDLRAKDLTEISGVGNGDSESQLDLRDRALDVQVAADTSWAKADALVDIYCEKLSYEDRDRFRFAYEDDFFQACSVFVKAGLMTKEEVMSIKLAQFAREAVKKTAPYYFVDKPLPTLEEVLSIALQRQREPIDNDSSVNLSNLAKGTMILCAGRCAKAAEIMRKFVPEESVYVLDTDVIEGQAKVVN